MPEALPEAFEPTKVTAAEQLLFFDSGNTPLTALTVVVEGFEYQLCEESSKNQWSNSKKGTYGKGLLYEEDDPYKPNRIGKLGEMAFSKLFGGKVDLAYRKFGDKFDFIRGGKKLDIKTAFVRHGYLLIRSVTESGVKIPLDKDIYIAQCVVTEDRTVQKAKIAVVGFLTKEDLDKLPDVEGRKGSSTSRHKNKQVAYKDLKPGTDLNELLRNQII